MKTILDKINKAHEIEANKTELAKHEVELALIDEAKKIVNELTKQSEELGKETLAIISAKERLSIKIDNLRKNVTPAKKVVEDFNKQLKDLGITDTPTIINNLMLAIEKSQKTALDFEKNFLN
jgi:hypothetical protein